MPVQTFSVGPATPRHLPGIVACHLASFPGQFLTRLGPGFLEAYYRFYLDSPQGINLVATDASGQVLGFVNGGAPHLRSRFTRSRVPGFAGLLLRRALTDPFVRRRLSVHLGLFLQTLWTRLGPRRQAAAPKAGPPPEDTAVLLSIAVDPSRSGQGIGRALMEGFRQECARRGYRAMTLSAHADNEAAIRLYRACGWQESHRDADGVYFRRETRP